jgi:hypothetical protein
MRNSRCRHHDGYQVDLDIQNRLFDLIKFDLLATKAGLSFSQPFHGDHSLLRGQEPCGHRRVGHCTAPETEQKCQCASKDVDILPSGQRAGCNLTKAIVQCSADDGEPAGTGEPPSLSKSLLFLRIVAADNSHEACRNDTFNKPCQVVKDLDSRYLKRSRVIPRKKRWTNNPRQDDTPAVAAQTMAHSRTTGPRTYLMLNLCKMKVIG